MAEQPLKLWGITVVESDVARSNEVILFDAGADLEENPRACVKLVLGDPGVVFDEMAREAIDRAREPHIFEPCDLAGPDGPWCAALCHHGPCFKTEAEHDG